MLVSLFLFPLILAQEESCIQFCTAEKIEKCRVYPNSPLCPDGIDIAKECELICQTEITLLNREFGLNIGQTIKVEDYNNIEITLIDANRECVEEGTVYNTRSGCNEVLVTFTLKIKNFDEEISVDIENKESLNVFGVRIDAVSYVSQGLSRDDPRYSEGDNALFGSLKPEAGLFGVYEKGAGGFWARITNWLSNLRGLFG